jgi:poly-gamma-glutamate synthesis protein (capsule biosynthesis protein)
VKDAPRRRKGSSDTSLHSHEWDASREEPADFFEARSGKDSRGFAVDPIYWESVVAVTAFRGGRLEEVRLYPIDMGYGRPRWQRGRPLLADGEVGQRILERLAGLSRPFGTDVAVKDGVGTIRP